MSAKQKKKVKANGPSRKGFDPIQMFLKIVLSMVLIFTVLAGGACFAYYKVTGSVPFSQEGVESVNASDTSFFDALLKKNIKINVAVFGVDADGTRTDVNFVVHYDSATKAVSLLSVPRDTKVNLTKEIQANIKAAGRNYSVETKFNAVHAYSGEEMGCKNAVLQLEDLLAIKIDHYVKIDFEAFRAIVDAVGGVDVDVPQDMYWDMRDTGDLLINLKKGMQHLDGAQAEQLVRFRRYKEGDVDRIAVQQAFLKALAEKILSTETIVKNLPDLVSVLYKYIETDVSLADMLKYVNYVDKVDMTKITMETLPGAGGYIGDISYFLHDPVETREMVDRVFYQTVPATPGTVDTPAADSKSLMIEVANGGTISGLAGQYSKKLQDAGYQVITPTNYGGEKNTFTRIQVKEKGIGEDLIGFFAEAKVEIAPNEITNGDIRIILGTNEK